MKCKAMLQKYFFLSLFWATIERHINKFNFEIFIYFISALRWVEVTQFTLAHFINYFTWILKYFHNFSLNFCWLIHFSKTLLRFTFNFDAWEENFICLMLESVKKLRKTKI